ncbi:hypothetical protein MRB53_014611 [Persea americana]|uniref:Uncharacterized protein n=1 Tax=Persea americana TaxID=3435 RepID=A0ACC2KBF9_PERAE|nr:hypothetical protein MRB53_014611 [Persea americana]
MCLFAPGFVCCNREDEREAAGSCVFCRHLPALFVSIDHRILRHRNRRSVSCARTAPPLQKRKATPGYRTGEEDYRIAFDLVFLHGELSPETKEERCCFKRSLQKSDCCKQRFGLGCFLLSAGPHLTV